MNLPNVLAQSLLAAGLVFAGPVNPAFAIEQQYKLPPIDRKDANRCELRSRYAYRTILFSVNLPIPLILFAYRAR
jgi:hypothetical protein